MRPSTLADGAYLVPRAPSVAQWDAWWRARGLEGPRQALRLAVLSHAAAPTLGVELALPFARSCLAVLELGEEPGLAVDSAIAAHLVPRAAAPAWPLVVDTAALRAAMLAAWREVSA